MDISASSGNDTVAWYEQDFPATDAPTRPTERKLSELPRHRKSKTDMEEPKRPLANTATLDPELANDLRLRLLPR